MFFLGGEVIGESCGLAGLLLERELLGRDILTRSSSDSIRESMQLNIKRCEVS
jgi:hypothetical protein